MRKRLAILCAAGAAYSGAAFAENSTMGNLQQYADTQVQRTQTEIQVNNNSRSGVDKGIGHWSSIMGIFDAARSFSDAADALHPDDASLDPSFSDSPMLPTHCPPGEAGDECMACYAEAYQEINFLRLMLERLRAIYGATKNYTEAAIAFGDSMSGLHGGFGMAWPVERKGIQDTFDKVGKTYDKKHADMMANLENALRQVAACEAQHFDTPGWYERFGFMYHSFMYSRYSRPK